VLKAAQYVVVPLRREREPGEGCIDDASGSVRAVERVPQEELLTAYQGVVDGDGTVGLLVDEKGVKRRDRGVKGPMPGAVPDRLAVPSAIIELFGPAAM
jgi:hypothetical protein